MSSVADALPFALSSIQDQVIEGINDLVIFESTIRETPLVNKIAQLTGEDVPRSDTKSYLRFLRDARDGKVAEAIDPVTTSLVVNSVALISQNGRIGELNIPTLIAGGGAVSNRNALKDAYDTAKVFFPSMDVVRSKYDQRSRDVLDKFAHIMGDVSLTHPDTSLRWFLGDYGTPVWHQTWQKTANYDPYSESNVPAVNTSTVYFRDSPTNGYFTMVFQRQGTGATPSTIIALLDFDTYYGDNADFIFTPNRIIDPTLLVFTAAATPAQYNNEIVAVPAVTITLTITSAIPGVPVRNPTINLTGPTTISLTYGDRIEISVTAVTGASISATNDRASAWLFTVHETRQSSQYATLRSAVASPTIMTSRGRGDALDMLGIVNTYAIANGAASLGVAIRGEYAARAGVNDLAAVTDLELFDLDWWLGNDRRVTNRVILSDVYVQLHKLLSSLLPFAMVNTNFGQFIVE